MFLFLLFFLHLYFSIALKEPTHKCIDCKFFLKPIPPFSSEFSKCNLYPNIRSNDKLYIKDNNLEQKKRKDLIDLLVNGYERKSEYGYFEIDYHYCSYARDSENMCGKEGNNFKKRLQD
jgi:hypothetical protein